MTQSWFPWLRRRAAHLQARRLAPLIPTPAVLCAATLCVGGPYAHERPYGPEQRRQRARLVGATIAAAHSRDAIVFDPSLASETITLSSRPLARSAATARSTASGPVC